MELDKILRENRGCALTIIDAAVFNDQKQKCSVIHRVYMTVIRQMSRVTREVPVPHQLGNPSPFRDPEIIRAEHKTRPMVQVLPGGEYGPSELSLRF